MTYIVRQGDTLYGISNQYGVSVDDIIKLNNLKSTNLSVGQKLIIPTVSGTNPDNTFTYIVKKGDTLYSIANIYDTNVSELIKLNNLKSTNLSIGQSLLIPEKYSTPSSIPNYINYTVKKGDSLYSIAKKYNIDVSTIIKDNSLNNANLSIGQNLKIRSKNTLIEECIGMEYNPSSNISTNDYKVVKGDSLYKIANRFNTSVSELIRLNNLTSNNLSIGQILKVPSSNNTNKIYIVQKGDSLYSISKKFNISVEEIKRKNNLSSNLLSIGQKLNL